MGCFKRDIAIAEPALATPDSSLMNDRSAVVHIYIRRLH